MGTSGAGGGGGGSGGGGGGGGGTGGSSGGGSGHGASGHGSGHGGSGHGGGAGKGTGGGGAGGGSSKGLDAASKASPIVRVLSRLKPNYLASQFTGEMTAGIARELSILTVDIESNRAWDSMCSRLNLKPGSSLASVRDAILSKYERSESDSRVKDTVTATVLQYFEALSRYNDDLLYGPGKDAIFAALDAEVVKEWLPNFLRLQYLNVLQREEPKLPDPSLRRTIAKVASELASKLSEKLRVRYRSSGRVAEGRYLQSAGKNEEETTWLVKAIRG